MRKNSKLKTQNSKLKIKPEEFTKKAIRFIRRELNKAGLKRAVVGLSGGVDSAVVAALCARAAGPDNVLGLIMPYETTSQRDINDARRMASQLGIGYEIISISSQINAYFKKFPRADRIRKGNKMARERMSILFDQARLVKALVAGTGNKSEGLLGYCTIYGDAAFSFNPIGSIYKTQIIQLARYLNVPDSIIKRTPSAGLWPGQTDEKELGISYRKLDILLYNLIDRKKEKSQLTKMGFSPALINRIINKIKSNEFKRRLPSTLTQNS